MKWKFPIKDLAVARNDEAFSTDQLKEHDVKTMCDDIDNGIIQPVQAPDDRCASFESGYNFSQDYRQLDFRLSLLTLTMSA